MKPDSFYHRVTHAAAHPPPDRHRLFSALHSEVASAYLAALQRIPSGQANQVVALGSDPRTLAQVVGHIAAWDQFAILAAGDILAGVQHPRMVTTVEGYKDREGQSLNFAGIEAFNAYQAAQHAAWSWDDIRELARRAATTLHVLFTHPGLLSVERLERTKPYRNRLGNGTIIQEITMGWTLWLTVLEHEAVEHAAELGIGQ